MTLLRCIQFVCLYLLAKELIPNNKLKSLFIIRNAIVIVFHLITLSLIWYFKGRNSFIEWSIPLNLLVSYINIDPNQSYFPEGLVWS